MVRLAVALAVVALFSDHAVAQQDTTPPELLSFSISPTIFDLSLGSVQFTWCVTATDNVWLKRASVVVGIVGVPGPPGNIAEGAGLSLIPLLGAQDSGCATFPSRDAPLPFGEYAIEIILTDHLENQSVWRTVPGN